MIEVDRKQQAARDGFGGRGDAALTILPLHAASS